MKPFVAAFLFFSMAMGVNDHEDENYKTSQYQNDQDRPIPPNLGHQVMEV
jgi:hypothetical protein